MVKNINKDIYFFIKKPVLAVVISLVITIIGLVSLYVLPIEQYPKVLPVQIKVIANYPGANSEVIATTVAAPLEQEINGVSDMLYIESVSSASGTLIITVTFDMSVDPDIAQVNVNNRVQSVLPFLPQTVRNLGLTVSKSSGSILKVITISSDNPAHDVLFINNYTTINIIDDLRRTNGVQNAALFGEQKYAMRVWLKSDAMMTYNVSANEVNAAITEQNSQYPIGKIGSEPTLDPTAFTYNINSKGRMSSVDEFENIVIRAKYGDASTLKLKDVARIELGSQLYGFEANLNNKPAVAVGIFLQDGANSLQTAAKVKEKMDVLSKSFPEGLNYKIPYDVTKFIKISVKEVIISLFEAMALVIFIVFLFIQNIRATIVAIIVIPISLIGTLAGMYVLDFSINLLTLFGMILAIGIVVDDAIVVIENVDYRMKKFKLSGKEAAIQSMKEVSWPIVTISLVLCMVFLPVSFLGGLVGVMYRQFAMVIAVSVIVSVIVSLSLTPVICSILLKKKYVRINKDSFFNKFNNFFDYITNRYIKGVEFLLKHSGLGLMIFISIVIATIYMAKKLPTALLPQEDQGYLISTPFLMPGASFDRSEKSLANITKQFLDNKNVENVISLVGYDALSGTIKTNTGTMFVTLKDWNKRKKIQDDARVLAGTFMQKMAMNNEAIVPVFNPPPIVGMSTAGGFEVYLQYKGSSSDISILNENLIKFNKAANARPELGRIITTFSYNSPQYYLTINNENVKSLGINIADLYMALKSNFGQQYVNDFTLYGRNYRVYMSAESSLRRDSDDIKNIAVKNKDGKMVSLASLVKLRRGVGTDQIDRYNLFPAAKIIGGPAPGYSFGQALTALQEVATSNLTTDFAIGYTGEAYEQLNTNNVSTYIFVFGIVMVFLILAALYEKWSLPFAVIITIPISIFGALIFTFLRGLYNDIYFQVGLLTLIGLSAKNAILIVEFAMLEYYKGVAIQQAITTAVRMRFRAIVMTSFAFIIGCVPLFISTGAGSASRQAVGTGVIGGMLASTFVATFFVPLFFKLIMQLSEKWGSVASVEK